MPYTITSTRLADPVFESSERVAVTLDEAHDAVLDEMLNDQSLVGLLRARMTREILAIPEAGGFVSLPDGTTVTVRPA